MGRWEATTLQENLKAVEQTANKQASQAMQNRISIVLLGDTTPLHTSQTYRPVANAQMPPLLPRAANKGAII